MMQRILSILDTCLSELNKLTERQNTTENNFRELLKSVLELVKSIKIMQTNQEDMQKRLEELERIQFNPGWEERPVGQPRSKSQ